MEMIIGMILSAIGIVLLVVRHVIGTKKGWKLRCFLSLYSDFFFIAANILLKFEMLIVLWMLSLVASVLSIIGFATGILVLKEREE